MKTIIKIMLLLIVIISFFSCKVNRPISRSTPNNNKTFEVDYLFEYDGCKVYRFSDMGHLVYFTNCNGEETSLKGDSTETRVTNINKRNVSK